MAEKFNEVIKVFPENLKKILSAIPENVKCNTYEIRVRLNSPLVLYGSYGTAFVDVNSIVSHMNFINSIIISDEELKHVISEVCGYSVYSHQSDILNGFVTYGSGNRVGFCSSAVTENEKIISINNITSLNIRVAREYDDTGKEIVSTLYSRKLPKGLIIAGAPCTGKTTVLKSMAKILSSEYIYGFRKCVVIDERFEMNRINAVNCDILSGYGKETGIIHAIRTLSPEIIICDEISSESEAEKIIKGLDSGVSFIVSVHVSDKNDLLRRRVSRMLITSGFFENIVILGGKEKNIRHYELIKTEALINETICCNSDSVKLSNDGIFVHTSGKQAYI